MTMANGEYPFSATYALEVKDATLHFPLTDGFDPASPASASALEAIFAGAEGGPAGTRVVFQQQYIMILHPPPRVESLRRMILPARFLRSSTSERESAWLSPGARPHTAESMLGQREIGRTGAQRTSQLGATHTGCSP